MGDGSIVHKGHRYTYTCSCCLPEEMLLLLLFFAISFNFVSMDVDFYTFVI